MLKFELSNTEGEARRGRLTLNHGVVETPEFMPVGTYGTVKGVLPASLPTIPAFVPAFSSARQRAFATASRRRS